MQDREGNPDVPGQWMEHGSEVGLPGLRIFLQTFPEDNNQSVSLTVREGAQPGLPGAIVICPWAGPGPGLLLARGVMEMEDDWAWPGTAT